ncbi:MAG: hypothetical protein ACTHMG_09855 [Sphingomonas sp.]
MPDPDFTVADFFRLGNEAAAHQSLLRIKEAEARADLRIKCVRLGLTGEEAAPPAQPRD